MTDRHPREAPNQYQLERMCLILETAILNGDVVGNAFLIPYVSKETDGIPEFANIRIETRDIIRP